MINLYELLKVANGQLFGETVATIFTEFCFEPQRAHHTALFVAIRSVQGDTHRHMEEAVQMGAVGLLCTEPPEFDTSGVTVIIVRDTTDALLRWSQHIIQKMGVEVVLVASPRRQNFTLAAISHVLRSRYQVLTGQVTSHGLWNLPASLVDLSLDDEIAVIALDITHPGEMQALAKVISPKVAVIDSQGCNALPAFESSTQYLQEVQSLFAVMQPDSLVIMDASDPYATTLQRFIPAYIQSKSIGVEAFGADLLALNIQVGKDRIGFDLRYGNERMVGRWSPVLGRHHLQALLSTLLVAEAFSISLPDALHRLTEPVTLPGQLTTLRGQGDCLLIDDTDSGTPTTTIAALDWLEAVSVESNRVILVLGDLEDTRIAADSQDYREIGLRAAQIVDVMVTLGVGAAAAGRAALDHGLAPAGVQMTFSSRDVQMVLEQLQLNEQDIVLVTGAAFMHMEKIVRALLKDESDSVKLVRQDDHEMPDSLALLRARPSWVEVDADALGANVRTIKAAVGEDVTLMAVVKADGYGHGAVLVAQTALHNGAGYLGVASLEEALQLRNAGITAPILILSYLPVEAVPQAIRLNLTATVFDMDTAQRYHRTAFGATNPLKVHVKLDTGMGRLGFFAEDAPDVFRELRRLSNLDVEGVFTHFSVADVDPNYTARQVELYREAVLPLQAAGLNIRYFHAANSPGVLRGEATYFNLVRPGLILYGLRPSDDMPMLEGLRPALSWKTTVLQVRDFPPMYPIGYGNTYHTKGDERIAILPVGYADGFRRSPQSWKYVLIRGQRAPLVGRVSMEKSAVNVTHIPDVRPGE
ncbi:MAG: alanine racemase, partial [Anaerolineae bacterium]|nr:alanine racemase [Anaerolineae bacterium]